MRPVFKYVQHWPHDAAPNPTRCAASICSGGRAPSFFQCRRKRTTGEWCKQHSPAGMAEREKARAARWAAQDAARERSAEERRLRALRDDYTLAELRAEVIRRTRGRKAILK